MGCLNSEGLFNHWFGNIHLSGPCNRSCYFCIGQHMMALDRYNNLDKWPLDNIDKFINKCIAKQITDINVTGTNTDPLLYKHAGELLTYIRDHIAGCKLGIRTNGVQVSSNLDTYKQYDKASITICSFDPDIYSKMMGVGKPPDIKLIASMLKDTKINIVLGPENNNNDLLNTIYKCSRAGITRINLREPYGQPKIGNYFKDKLRPSGHRLGMPYYIYYGVDITYWDIHLVEVESVNLYANGIVSETYPITKGHHPAGKVLDQSNFPGGRINQQWQYSTQK